MLHVLVSVVRRSTRIGSLIAIGWSSIALKVAADPSEDVAELRGQAVEIVLVSPPAGAEELHALLRELLERHGIRVEFSQTRRFESDALFARAPEDTRARVFIRFGESRLGRLYFRAPDGERFLLRTIALPSALDDVGREVVAQVVESSVVTLLRSSDGMSREQASAEISREDATEPSVVAARPEPRGRPQGGATLQAWTALRYSVGFSGPDLGVAHGPGVELGIGRRDALILRGRIVLERGFDQTLRARDLTASVQTSAVRAGVDVGIPVTAASGAIVSLAAGLDVSDLEPLRARADVRAAEPQTDVEWAVRPELRYELAGRSLALAAVAFVDVALVRTHYYLLDDDRQQRLGAPWTVRPGGAIALGLIIP